MSNSRKKIIYLIDIYNNPWGGTEGQLYKLLERIPQYGYEPEMVVFKPNEYIDNHDMPCDVEVLGIRSLFSINAFMKMYKFAMRIKRDNVELVHIYFNDASILAPIFLKMFGLKVLISRRDMGFWYNLVNIFILRINRYFVDLVIVNSKAVKLITVKKERYSSKKIKVIYNGVELDGLNETHHGNLRKELNLDAEDIIIGFVANLRPIKRMDDVVVALSMLKKQDKEIHLVIIGEDKIHNGKSLKDEYILLAEKYGVQKYVHFLGAIRNVKPYVSEFDIGVMSSESEGLSNSIIEYMASSKPTVCTRGSGNSELITHNKTGLLYEVGDIDALASNLSYLINNRDSAHLMGENSKNEVKKMFNINKCIKSHADVYDVLLKK